jgi:hypothetical protein
MNSFPALFHPLSLRKIPIFGGQTMSDMVTIPEALGQLPSGKLT